MKRIILFLEDDFFKILQDFKKNALRDTHISDEKAMTLMTWYFMEFYNNSHDSQ